jgi:hypothetical protein
MKGEEGLQVGLPALEEIADEEGEYPRRYARYVILTGRSLGNDIPSCPIMPYTQIICRLSVLMTSILLSLRHRISFTPKLPQQLLRLVNASFARNQ